MSVLAVIGVGCSPAPQPAQSPAPTASSAPEVAERSVVHVTLHPARVAAPFRWSTETAGLATALVDLALSDLADVVVEVPDVPMSPGATRALPVGEAWSAYLELGSDPKALTVGLRLCDAALLCHEVEQVTTREQLQQAIPGLVGQVGVRIGHAPAPGAMEDWGAPLSSDDYAVLVAGRAAATWYGLRERVPDASKGDRMKDPLARAVFIDPSVAVSQWVMGRRLAADGDWARARVAFTAASLGRASSVHLRADEAEALSQLQVRGAASAAWDALAERQPGDPRFLLPQARAALAADRIAHATALVEALLPRYGDEPAVAELRVRVADRSGVPADPDALLAAWQHADPVAAEPVRRRIHLRIRRGLLDQALALVPELARRGAEVEAEELRMALAVGLSRWDEAAAAAAARGDPGTADRIRGRGALEAGEPLPDALLTDDDPEVRLVAGAFLLERGDAVGALERAQSVLKRQPWHPEALSLQARALRVLGRDRDAEKAEATLRLVEPARG